MRTFLGLSLINTSSLTWNARELASQTLSDGTTLNYTYNSDGIRTRKVYNDSANSTSYLHNYILDGTKILRETVTITAIGGGISYDLHYVYDESGNVVGLHYNNKPYYFQKNLQGDVIRILDYSGNVVVEYTYDAWGKVLSVSGSMANTLGQRNPFRYRSYYYDTETGFYYLQSRYYDPVVGRFLNADAIIGANGGIQGYNMFAYCNNNPVNYYDVEGYIIKSVFDTIIKFGGRKFSFEKEQGTRYGTISVTVEFEFHDIPEFSTSIGATTVSIDDDSATIYLPDGKEVNLSYDDERIELDSIALGELDLKHYTVQPDVSIDGAGITLSQTVDNVTYSIRVGYEIEWWKVILNALDDALTFNAPCGGGCSFGGAPRLGTMAVSDLRFV